MGSLTYEQNNGIDSTVARGNIHLKINYYINETKKNPVEDSVRCPWRLISGRLEFSAANQVRKRENATVYQERDKLFDHALLSDT